MTYQKQSNLIFRLIIGVFLSCTFLTINAQELDPVIIKSNDPKEETTYKPIQTKPSAVESDSVVSLEETNQIDEVGITTRAVTKDRSDETYKKEEYLSKLLRQTYYQKLTTNKWSKYLHPEGWKKNVEKWRYWSQLKEYITSNQDVLVLRSTSADIREEVVAQDINDVSIVDSTEKIEEVVVLQNVTEQPRLDVEKESDEIEIIDTVVSSAPNLVSVTIAPWLKDKPIISEEQKRVEAEEIDVAESMVDSKSLIAEEPKENIAIKEKEEIVIAEVIPPSTDKKSVTKKAAEEVIIKPVQAEQSKPVEIYQPPKTTIVTSDPEDFGDLKGVLPWPVSGGRVTDAFGIRKNAEARGLRPENYGIDMVCPSGTIVNASHSGTVLLARRQSPYDYIVTIKHGNYTSAYYYLITPYVKQGDVVQSGQAIGQLRTSVAEADFHFEIWSNQDRVDPQLWLQRR